MATPDTVGFADFTVTIQDPNNVAAGFQAPCGFLKNAIKQSKSTSSTPVPDCTDPSGTLAWELTSASGASISIDSSGVMAGEDQSLWRRFWLFPGSWQVQVTYDVVKAAGGGFWQGAAVCSDIGDDADYESKGARVMRSVSLKSDGAWAWTDAAA